MSYASAYYNNRKAAAENRRMATCMYLASRGLFTVLVFVAGAVSYSYFPQLTRTQTRYLKPHSRPGTDVVTLPEEATVVSGPVVVVEMDDCPPNDPYCLLEVPDLPTPPQTPALPASPAVPDTPAGVPETHDKPETPATVGGAVVLPPRDSSMAPMQRPQPIAPELLTSHVFEELTVASLNPPVPFEQVTSKPEELAELRSRLVIGIGMGVHSGHSNIEKMGLMALPVFNTLLQSFFATAQTHFIYRFYFAFDHNDSIYEDEAWRAKITAEFNRLVAENEASRWHPAGYKPGQIDASTLLVTLHWVHCNYAAKPAWAHSDAIMAAYKEGADYAYRTNDDTAFPTVPDWVDRFVLNLRERDIPNLGVVGPKCNEGANWILTHDFTHRTHGIIFGFHYPRSLPDWSSDDWITYVYKQFNLMQRLEDTPVEHRLHGTRYNPQERHVRLAALNMELTKGVTTINEWTKAHYNKSLPSNVQVITCC